MRPASLTERGPRPVGAIGSQRTQDPWARPAARPQGSSLALAQRTTTRAPVQPFPTRRPTYPPAAGKGVPFPACASPLPHQRLTLHVRLCPCRWVWWFKEPATSWQAWRLQVLPGFSWKVAARAGRADLRRASRASPRARDGGVLSKPSRTAPGPTAEEVSGTYSGGPETLHKADFPHFGLPLLENLKNIDP